MQVLRPSEAAQAVEKQLPERTPAQLKRVYFGSNSGQPELIDYTEIPQEQTRKAKDSTANQGRSQQEDNGTCATESGPA
jgi:hypothetical protein